VDEWCETAKRLLVPYGECSNFELKEPPMPRIIFQSFEKLWMGVSLFVLVLPFFAEAAPFDAAPVSDSKFSITLYSTADPGTFDPQAIVDERQANSGYKIPGYGVVRELRRISLTQGENLLKFSDVAAGIDPTTVSFKSLTAPDSTAVVEQNFEYDLVSPDKLLEKYIGKSIIINRKQEPLPTDHTRMPETIEAKLLSFTTDQLVLQTNNKQLPIQIIPRNHDIAELKLFDLQSGLITKPTLVWKINAQQGGEHNVLVSYQTDHITWRADYALTLNAQETAADLSCWATLVNQSGASYPNAKIKLVAGDVQKLRSEGNVQRAYPVDVREKALFEYHAYTIGRPTSLGNNSIKQVELFAPKGNIPFSKEYVYAGDGDLGIYGEKPMTERSPRGVENKKVDVILKLANDEKAGLGIPLPAGRVRIYARDAADAGGDLEGAGSEFVGEDVIEHSPKGQMVSIRTGSAFDITGERKKTDYSLEGKTMTETFEIKLHNRKKEGVKVMVKERLYRWSQWEITASSEKFAKENGRVIGIPVEVGVGGEKVVTYTVKYSW